MAYNPSQPRDAKGEWSSGGATALRTSKPLKADRLPSGVPGLTISKASMSHAKPAAAFAARKAVETLRTTLLSKVEAGSSLNKADRQKWLNVKAKVKGAR